MFPSSFTTFYSPESIDFLLHKPDCSIEDLLSDDNFLSELKFQNQALLKL